MLVIGFHQCVAPGMSLAPQKTPSQVRVLSSRRSSRQNASSRGVVQIYAAAAVEKGVAAGAAAAKASAPPSDAVRVRFAPSPTGNLHVGGARTALFNWLYARRTGGKFILRVEDTDTARSTRASEDAMVADLKWLGLEWDEGPDVGGPYGPYRQSERAAIYKEWVDKLVAEGKAYPCFCTEEELEAMKKDAEAKGLPPIYRGKWANASAEEVKAEMAKGVTPSYRFRVPPTQTVTINDLVRGEVSWSTDTLGDFVILRSNGLPVYNFCVTIDDALMKITHVLRAEEHLPNTLRQILIYQAFGWQPPLFGHMSIILAPDRSKLSKRHGATSVGEFKRLGYLSDAMNNYLALLGWNDGTTKEMYSIAELRDAFSVERITKSAAIFDRTKLDWMNGQILRALPEGDIVAAVGKALHEAGTLTVSSGPFVTALTALSKKSLEKTMDGAKELQAVLSYPLETTVGADGSEAVPEFAEVKADGFKEFGLEVLAALESGEIAKVSAEGPAAFKAWVNALGKKHGRKGKRLFMPVRVCLTGVMHGADVGEQLALLASEKGEVADRAAIVPLEARAQRLRKVLEAL